MRVGQAMELSEVTTETVPSDSWFLIGIPRSFDHIIGPNTPAVGPSEVRACLSARLHSGGTTSAWFDKNGSYVPRERVNLFDLGDITDSGDMDQVLEKLTEALAVVYSVGGRAIVLGGEQSITVGVAAALLKQHGAVQGLYLDKHLDRALGHATDFPLFTGNHATYASNMGVAPIQHFGIREVEYIHPERMAEFEHIQYLTTEQFEETSTPQLLSQVDSITSYLSVDMAILDPAYAPEVTWPVPFGVSQRRLRSAVSALSAHTSARALCITEITGSQGGPNRAALIATQLILDVLQKEQVS
jgi:agmatinase